MIKIYGCIKKEKIKFIQEFKRQEKISDVVVGRSTKKSAILGNTIRSLITQAVCKHVFVETDCIKCGFTKTRNSI